MNEKLWTIAQEAELALAGLAIIAPRTLNGLDVTGNDFIESIYGRVFDTAKALAESGEPISNSRMIAEAKRIGLDVVDIAKLANSAPNPDDAEYYAEELQRVKRARYLESTCQAVLNDIATDSDIEPLALAERLEAELSDIRKGNSNSSLVSLGTAIDETLANHRESIAAGRVGGLSTGFRDLDELTGGFFPGQLWLLAARSYVGKTALALELAGTVAARRGVLFVSLEMTRSELVDRMLCSESGIALDLFAQSKLNKAELALAAESSEKLRQARITFTDSPTETVQTIRAKAKLLQAREDVSLVVVDNLQLMQSDSPKLQRYEQLSRITGELKRLAKELRATVLLLSQLNADADNASPTDKHYSGSKQILADADVAMLMHRQTKTDSQVELNITKNRRGAPGKLYLDFDGAVQRFSEQELAKPWEG
jgi:replicative DNA helicase